jgi:hypothetical protein
MTVKKPNEAQITLETAISDAILEYERAVQRIVIGISVSRISVQAPTIEAITIPR